MDPETDPREVGQRIEALLGQLGTHASPEVATATEELAELLMGMYGAGLERIVTLLGDSPGGVEQLRALAADELVGALLVLHDLHPEDTAARAARALESVRPYLGSHAGDVELLGVDDDAEAGGPVVRLALKGSCDGCPSSAVTVTTAISTAIEEACPEVVRVDVDGLVPSGPAGGVGGPGEPRGAPGRELPLLQISSRPPEPEVAVSWVVLDPPRLRPGQYAVVDAAGHPVLVALPAGAHAEGGPVAYADRCGACGGSLAGADLRGAVLGCPSCAARYDVRRAGAPVGPENASAAGGVTGGAPGDGPRLEPLPLVRRAGGWRLALPRPPGSRNGPTATPDSSPVGSGGAPDPTADELGGTGAARHAGSAAR